MEGSQIIELTGGIRREGKYISFKNSHYESCVTRPQRIQDANSVQSDRLSFQLPPICRPDGFSSSIIFPGTRVGVLTAFWYWVLSKHRPINVLLPFDQTGPVQMKSITVLSSEPKHILPRGSSTRGRFPPGQDEDRRHSLGKVVLNEPCDLQCNRVGKKDGVLEDL